MCSYFYFTILCFFCISLTSVVTGIGQIEIPTKNPMDFSSNPANFKSNIQSSLKNDDIQLNEKFVEYINLNKFKRNKREAAENLKSTTEPTFESKIYYEDNINDEKIDKFVVKKNYKVKRSYSDENSDNYNIKEDKDDDSKGFFDSVADFFGGLFTSDDTDKKDLNPDCDEDKVLRNKNVFYLKKYKEIKLQMSNSEPVMIFADKKNEYGERMFYVKHCIHFPISNKIEDFEKRKKIY